MVAPLTVQVVTSQCLAKSNLINASNYAYSCIVVDLIVQCCILPVQHLSYIKHIKFDNLPNDKHILVILKGYELIVF